MTKKIYLENPKLRKFETEIIAIEEQDGYVNVILEETAFYPGGGGQPSDRGTINGVEVRDCEIKNGIVIHKLKEAPADSHAVCEIDWNRRFDHMQQHSGQHLLSAAFHSLFGMKTVSFHLGRETATIDLEGNQLTGEQVAAVEMLANQWIQENLSVTAYFVSKEKLEDLPVVKMPKVTDNIRIVEIEGIEYNPCGGTHIERTGELSLIKIRRTEKLKEQVQRVTFVCGMRAWHDYNETSLLTDTIAAHFNTNRKEIQNRIKKLETRLKQLEEKNEELVRRNAHFEAERLLLSSDHGLISQVLAEKEWKEIQQVAEAAADRGCTVLLAGKDNKLLLVCSSSAELNCGVFFNKYLKEFGGRGGGSATAAQAGFSSRKDLLNCFAFMKKVLFAEQEKSRLNA